MTFLKALLFEIFRPVICLLSGIYRVILFKRVEKQSSIKADIK